MGRDPSVAARLRPLRDRSADERRELVARALATALLALVVVAAAHGSGAATPQPGGTVVVSRPPGMTCLNVFGPCNVLSADPVLGQVLEGAFEIGPDLAFRPNLVSSVSIGRNPFTLTYRIRPKARWSDGVPVSSADFLFTYRMFATQRSPTVDEREFYAKIRRVRVLGEKTFRVELHEPLAGWREYFNYVLPRHALVGVDITAVWRDRLDNPKTGRAIGNGPFLVSRFEPGSELVLVRNPRYWGPHTAYLDRYVVRFTKSEPGDPLGALKRGEIDFTTNVPGVSAPLTAELAEQAARIPGWRVVAWPAPGDEHLAFRIGPGGHPALRNKLVRRALAYGIDRAEIARTDLRGAHPLDSTVFHPGEPFYRPAWRTYRYRPAESRRLLEQAGCRRGADGIYACAGERLSLRFVTLAGSPVRERVVKQMQNQLRPAGVEVQITYAAPTVVFNTILPRGEFDAALFAWFHLAGGHFPPEGLCGDVQNWTGYCSRLVMRDLQQSERILDPLLRAAVLNSADVKLARDVPLLPVLQPLSHAALKRTIHGFVPGGTQFNYTQNTEDWWVAR
jgi:peptide/nickel transport system substrate-binding protein